MQSQSWVIALGVTDVWSGSEGERDGERGTCTAVKAGGRTGSWAGCVERGAGVGVDGKSACGGGKRGDDGGDERSEWW